MFRFVNPLVFRKKDLMFNTGITITFIFARYYSIDSKVYNPISYIYVTYITVKTNI